ncbi:MAG: flagellar protein FlgN [Vampirovibrio sp.]|nr:flagellar protein FlgN [Vampirovibrio sp.]
MTSTQHNKALKQLLEQQVDLSNQVEAKMLDRKAAIIVGDPQPLGALDEELLTLGRQLEQIEKKRQALMVEMGVESDRLTDVIDTLPPADVAVFQQLHKKLKTVTQNIQEINQSSKTLLELSLKYIEQTVQIIADALLPEGAGYTQTGGKTDAQDTSGVLGQSKSTIEHSA